MPVADSTLRRGLVLLTHLGGADGGRTVSELAALSGFERSQVSRTMGTLTDLGAVMRDPRTRAYRLSWSIYALAATAGDPGGTVGRRGSRRPGPSGRAGLCRARH